jgi:hypothetical protein
MGAKRRARKLRFGSYAMTMNLAPVRSWLDLLRLEHCFAPKPVRLTAEALSRSSVLSSCSTFPRRAQHLLASAPSRTKAVAALCWLAHGRLNSGCKSANKSCLSTDYSRILNG